MRTPRNTALAALLGAVLVVLLARPVQADEHYQLEPGHDEPPESITHEYSPYERQTIELTAEQLGLEVDPQPEGKIVERVHIIPLDVIERRDPAPGILNVLHTTTRPRVIRRELMVHVGDRYRKVVVDESARNLRQLLQLSVVLLEPMRGSRPDRVVLLVITKDIWSLRLNSNIQYTRGGIEKLILQPSEINLMGLHHVASVRFELDPAATVFGTGYAVPRMGQHRLTAGVEGNVIVNRQSAQPEGSWGGIVLGRPLLSTRTRWSWSTQTQWMYEVTRLFSEAQLATFDARITPDNDRIPFRYRTRRILHTSQVTRSFGWANKRDLSLGGQYDARTYATPGLDEYSPEAVEEFRNRRVPRNDTRIGPYIQGRAYTTSFVRVLDFETLALQEDYRLGHDLILRLSPGSDDLGSSRTTLGVFAAAQYTFALLDGVVRVGLESETQNEPERLADGSVRGMTHVATPRLGFGRLVADSYLLYRYRNFLNRTSYLGGNNRLRGYPSNYDVGQSIVAHNVEFRTTPVEILSLQLGGAAFYDVGDAFENGEGIRIKQSVGGGIRALFPQLDRVVFRADVGVPVTKGTLPAGVSPWSFFATMGQAFDMPSVVAPASGL